ncbi:uncharacterized protein [Lolium perenne]|uniref:uncharacterized protein n=1 Tax=Lolium perenne TaxID=4522 RepID=UPI0021F5AE21|nr:uncharacterized protein LOC127303296 [Lolium perenne]
MSSSSIVLLIGASMTVFLVLSLVTFLCANRQQLRSVVDAELGRGRACAAGIDEDALAAYPTMMYSKLRRDHGRVPPFWLSGSTEEIGSGSNWHMCELPIAFYDHASA